MASAETKAILAKMGLKLGGLDHTDGARDIEWGWILSHVPHRGESILDFGCGRSPLSLWMAQLGHFVMAVDLEPCQWPYRHERLSFIRGDVRRLELNAGAYSVIVNCSSVEHVGLSGRYGVKEDEPDGDLAVMKCLHRLLKPSGLMLLTIPVGRDASFPPLHRVYGGCRLPSLLEGFKVETNEFWARDEVWHRTYKPDALGRVSYPLKYGLGLFALRKETL